jgi:NIMA-interacting peptidyl-prolyl cis-trans isomerase 4
MAKKKGKQGNSDTGEENQSKVMLTMPANGICQADTETMSQGKGGLKAATAINVRHILCEKHSKATEALEKIQV